MDREAHQVPCPQQGGCQFYGACHPYPWAASDRCGLSTWWDESNTLLHPEPHPLCGFAAAYASLMCAPTAAEATQLSHQRATEFLSKANVHFLRSSSSYGSRLSIEQVGPEGQLPCMHMKVSYHACI